MYKKTTLPNGLRIITVPMADTKTVTVLVLVATGSKYETKKINGISHFLEHMTFKGTKKRGTPLAIVEPLDRIGSQYNAFTGQEYTGYYAKANSRHLDLLLDIVSDITLNPKFKQEEINKERGVIIEEINMYEDNPAKKIGDIWTDLLYGDQPAGWDTAGKKEIIAKLMRGDFVKYHNDHYVASKTVAVVSGNIEHDNIVHKIKKLFKSISNAKGKDKIPAKESQKNPEIKVFYKKTDQTHIALGVRSYNIFDKRRYAADVLATILGGGMSSRLFQLLRDKMGAAYYVRTFSDESTDTGNLATWAGIDNRRTEEIIKAILEEYRKIKNIKVSAAELLKPEEVIKKIRAVAIGDVLAVAQDIFKSEKLNLAIIGPYKNKEQFENLLRI
ncbi:MAG: Processing protease [Candidatus Azambacteria bacterium GW2011_GWA2_39_10]|uniref:Processing protease n=1 Tax=Candidatus Azambacteria bacterium GW2011_GWA2_39_10 TaxID=1618611 RepID=A0A0G0LTD3_9BACT|nr:MAG: Processing protease [Candidatus Azambacteria bacterium GW2011_GWA2_39_10]